MSRHHRDGDTPGCARSSGDTTSSPGRGSGRDSPRLWPHPAPDRPSDHVFGLSPPAGPRPRRPRRPRKPSQNAPRKRQRRRSLSAAFIVNRGAGRFRNRPSNRGRGVVSRRDLQSPIDTRPGGRNPARCRGCPGYARATHDGTIRRITSAELGLRGPTPSKEKPHWHPSFKPVQGRYPPQQTGFGSASLQSLAGQTGIRSTHR